MYPGQKPRHKWRVLLIGGSSGVGKTVAAGELARSLSLSLLLLDDVRLALQQATNRETHPELHVFLQYQEEQWRNSEAIAADWIAVGQAMTKPLQAIIRHHLIVPGVGPIIVEGDGILPGAGRPFAESGDVCTVFIVEDQEAGLLHNLQSRGRGFHELDRAEQEGFAHASWLYGQWLLQEAKRLELPVILARPQATLLERLFSAAGMEQVKTCPTRPG
jgi:2-phosphoglycerate kinase